MQVVQVKPPAHDSVEVDKRNTPRESGTGAGVQGRAPIVYYLVHVYNFCWKTKTGAGAGIKTRNKVTRGEIT